MKTQTIHARIDPKVKKSAEKVLNQIGLTMSEAIGLFLKQMANRQQFPLELKIPNKETIKVFKDIAAGKNLTSYSSVDELFEKLQHGNKKNNSVKKVRKRIPLNGKTRHEMHKLQG